MFLNFWQLLLSQLSAAAIWPPFWLANPRFGMPIVDLSNTTHRASIRKPTPCRHASSLRNQTSSVFGASELWLGHASGVVVALPERRHPCSFASIRAFLFYILCPLFFLFVQPSLRWLVLRGCGFCTIMEDVADFVQLWKLRIPSKAAVFVWRLLRDRLPTKANLNRRQVEIQDQTCPFCRSTVEDTPHLFFQCSKIIPLWWETTSWVNISTVFPLHQRQHFAQHMIDGVKGICVSRWRVWWVALTWSVWQMRNNIIFSNGIFNGNKLMEDAIFLFLTWLRNYEKDFVTNYNQWSSNLIEAFAVR